MMDFLAPLVPIIVVAAIIGGIVAAINRGRRDRSGRAAPGIGARNAFLYLFSFAALMVSASGASILIGFIIDSLRGGRLVSGDENDLALGIALVLVGTPAWIFTWRRMLKSSAEHPNERRSLVRGFYIYVIEAVSVGFLVAGSILLLYVILGAESFDGTSVAWMVPWGLVWTYHWWIESKLTPGERAATPFRAIYVYIASAVFLGMLLTGLGIVLYQLLDRSYVSLFIDDLLVSPSLWGDTMKISISIALVSGFFWWWHWFRAVRSDLNTVLRQVYIYIFGILFGVVTVVATSSTIAVVTLQWILSTPSISPADEHFRILTALIPSMTAGGALWSYHTNVLQREMATANAPESARRAYNYLVASLSLATLATGLVFLLALFISVTVREARDYLVERTGWQGQLSIVLTLLGVGGGIWAYYWWKIQRSVKSSPDELETSSRRIYIYSVFGVSALAALGSLSATLFLLLQAILDSNLGGETLRDAQWAIAVLVTSGITSGYFALVIREDRSVLAVTRPPEQRVARKIVTVLAPGSALGVADLLAGQLGYEVNVWLEPDGVDVPSPSDADIEKAVAKVTSAQTDRVLVIVSIEGIDVRPFRPE